MDSCETDLNFDDRETGLMYAYIILSHIPIDHFISVFRPNSYLFGSQTTAGSMYCMVGCEREV